MHGSLTNLPVFDPEALRAKSPEWKKAIAAAGPGGNRIVIEWGVGRGPDCYVYPASKRALGISLVTANSRGQNDERWADFLEFEYVPQVVEAIKGESLNPQVICVDLRPLQIQRQRRRKIDADASAKTGLAASAH